MKSQENEGQSPVKVIGIYAMHLVVVVAELISPRRILHGVRGAQVRPIIFLAGQKFTLRSLRTALLLGSNGLQGNTWPLSHWTGGQNWLLTERQKGRMANRADTHLPVGSGRDSRQLCGDGRTWTVQSYRPGLQG